MGDADSSQVLTGQDIEEIETWMDDAMEEMEDGMDNLLAFMGMINERIALLTSEVGGWKKFRRSFTALNLFVVPVVMAVGLFFGGKVLGFDPEVEVWQQMITTILMYIWGTMSLPVYLFTMWDTFVTDKKLTESLSSRRVRNISCNTTDDQNRNSDFSYLENDHLVSPSTQNSIERFSELGRTILEHISQGRRRPSQTFEVMPMDEQDSDTERRIEIPEADDDGEEAIADLQVPNVGSDKLSKTEFIRLGAFRTEESDFCGVNVIIVNPSSEFSVEIQKNDETLNEAEDRKPQIEEDILVELENEQKPILCKMVVESVGEGDRCNTFLKDMEDVGGIACWQKQGFGL